MNTHIRKRKIMDLEALKLGLNLPGNIMKDIDKIVLERRGNDEQSYMITEDVIGYVAPRTVYQLTLDGFIPTSSPETPRIERTEVLSPPIHVQVSGTWTRSDDTNASDANIFGGFGTLELRQSVLEIPEAPSTVEAFAYYDAHLIKVGDCLELESDANLPVTLMSIGSTYVDHYLKIEEKGGGAYIEYHDRPHFHMPMDESATGHLILGRSQGDEYVFSAFKIPYGYGVYTSPYALHTDAYLVGKYLVVFSVTEDFSTVIIRTADQELVDLRVGHG